MVGMYRVLPANRAGRDFIMGDLHGCLDLLEIELSRVAFDPSADRLFSVGDLVDRGPDSMGCLRLLREPWFHAVRGNHEDMLIAYFREAELPEESKVLTDVFLRNGGRWVMDLDSDAKAELHDDLLPRVAALPYAISVGQHATRFNVVHAELMTGNVDPDSWLLRLAGRSNESTPRLLTDADLSDTVVSELTQPLAWGRRLIKSANLRTSTRISTPAGAMLKSCSPMHPGLSLTYVGHTPQETMVLHESHLFIDRGAFRRKSNTCLLMVNHQQVLSWLS